MKGGMKLDLINTINRCQLGDLEAFNELYDSYHDKALKTAYLISNHKGIAEDIVQEAFIQCFYGMKKLRDIEKFNSWFYRILVRVSWRMLSKFKYGYPLEEMDDSAVSDNNQSSVEEMIENNETYHKIQESLETLSKPMKTAVILYYYNDMTVGEIANVLGCFEGTVKSRLYHARKCIKTDLEEYFKDDFSKIVFQRKECNNHG